MRIWSKFRSLLLKSKLEAEMTEEMRHHVELQTELNIKAGMKPDDARYAALRQFGNVASIQAQAREQRGWLWLVQLVQDLRLAVRSLRRSPGFSVAVILILALGIGASTSVFNLIYSILIDPFPYAKAGEIWAPRVADLKSDRGVALRVGDYLELSQLPGVALAMATSNEQVTLSGDPYPDRIGMARVTGTAFQFLGVPPLLGRGFTPSDLLPNGEAQPVTVLSFRLWQQRFNGDPAIVGRSIMINNVPYTVLGVMPPRFGWYGNDALWLPLATTDRLRGANPILRLQPGVSKEVVEQQLQLLYERLARETPERFPKDGLKTQLFNYLDVTVARGGMRTSLLMLFVAVGLLLLIACANVANLQLARGASRSREIAVRLAIGASRARLFCQLLTESVALATTAGAVGVFLAFGLTQTFVALLPPNAVPNESSVAMNGWVLAFAVVISVLTGIISGMVPGLQCTRPDLNRALKDGGHGAAGDIRGGRTRNLLVVSSVAFSVVLLVVANLAVRGFADLYRHDWGFRSDRLLVLRVPLPPERYTTIEQRNHFSEMLLARVQNLPGVVSAAFGWLPFNSGEAIPFQITGQPRVEGRKIGGSLVSAGFRTTFGLTLRAGRDLTEWEVERGDPVALISEATAKLWPAGENPIGGIIELDALGGPSQPTNLASTKPAKAVTVVGIVNDTRNANFRADPPPALYVPYTVRGLSMVQFLVRTEGQPMALLPQVRTELRALDESLPLYRPVTVEEIMGQQTVLPRFNMVLFSSLAALALVLATAGVYSVLAFNVAMRTREIGVRMALGAVGLDIVRLVLSTGGRLVGSGLIVGLGVSLGITRLAQNQMFDVPAFDLLAFVAAAVALGLAALIACLLPARRAAKVDPMIALRAE